MKNEGMSWGWIIFWLFVFWPIGLYFLFKKMTDDKLTIMSRKARTLSIIGWILLFSGVFGFSLVSDESYDFGSTEMFILIGFIVGGVLLIRKASKTKKTVAKYKKYIEMIVNHDYHSIDSIASAIGLSRDIVLKELQEMIDRDYLEDAFIDQSKGEIILEHNQKVASEKLVRCPICGTNNVVTIGRVSKCEYCGEPIQAQLSERTK